MCILNFTWAEPQVNIPPYLPHLLPHLVHRHFPHPRGIQPGPITVQGTQNQNTIQELGQDNSHNFTLIFHLNWKSFQKPPHGKNDSENLMLLPSSGSPLNLCHICRRRRMRRSQAGQTVNSECLVSRPPPPPAGEI